MAGKKKTGQVSEGIEWGLLFLADLNLLLVAVEMNLLFVAVEMMTSGYCRYC